MQSIVIEEIKVKLKQNKKITDYLNRLKENVDIKISGDEKQFITNK